MLFFTIVFFKLFPRYTGVHSTVGRSVCAAKGSQCKPGVACVQLVLSHPVILQSRLCVFEGLLPGIEGSWWKVAQTFSTCSRRADRRMAGCWSTNCTHCRRALKNTPLNVSHYRSDFPEDSSAKFFTLSQFLLWRMVRVCWSPRKDFHWIQMTCWLWAGQVCTDSLFDVRVVWKIRAFSDL